MALIRRLARWGFPGLACVALGASLAGAQQPLNLGSASGHGLGAMTEARLADAALWNPALAGIFEGPARSFALLGVTASPASGTLVRLGAAMPSGFFAPGVGRVTAPLRDAIRPWAGRTDGGVVRGDAAVQWVGLHAEDLLVSVSSRLYTDITVPQRAVQLLLADDAARTSAVTMAEQNAMTRARLQHTAVSTAAVAKGTSLAAVPFFGRTWLGVSGKASLVHQSARGRLAYDDAMALATTPTGAWRDGGIQPGEEEVGLRYAELGVRRVQLYSGDVGIVAIPHRGIIVSVVGSNLLQLARVTAATDALYERRIHVSGRDADGLAGRFAEEWPLSAADTSVARRAEMDRVLRATHFTPVLRGGVALETRVGRITAAYQHPWDNEPSIDRATLDRWSLGLQDPAHAGRPRFSYTRRIDGASVLASAVERGFCGDRVAVGGMMVRSPDHGQTYGITVQWSRGSGPCGRFR